MNKLKIILAASIAAAALTLSCSDDSGGGGPSGGPVSKTETYTLEDNGTNFTFEEVYKRESCEEGGVLQTEDHKHTNTVPYTIKDNILTCVSGNSDDDTLQFKGNSTTLIGTWTRTKDKAKSCKIDEEYKDEYYCKNGWNITKAVITSTSIAFTTDYCWTDENVDGYVDSEGWKTKVIDCNTIEYSKGSDKVTYRRTETSRQTTYNGKTCTWNEPSKATKEAACRKAATEHPNTSYLDNYYDDIIWEAYDKCERDLKLPWGEDDASGKAIFGLKK